MVQIKMDEVKISISYIPDTVIMNFREHCNKISGDDDKLWLEIRNTELQKYNGIYRDCAITFESQAHYEWFLMRWI